MAQGAIYQTFDTDTLIRTIADVIHNIDPRDVPLVSMLGLNNDFQLTNKGNHKYEWLTDTLRVRAGQAAEAIDGSETEIDVDDSSLFKPGDVVLVDSEKMWISAVNTTASPNTITVTRGWGSTSATTHADDSAITYLYSARLEGDDSDDAPYTNPAALYNEAQILHWEVEVTGSEEISPRYGIPDQLAYQMAKAIGGGGRSGGRAKAGDLLIDLEKTFFYGERVARVGKTTAGAMGGFKTFVTSEVTDALSAELTYDMLMDSMQGAWENGGTPDCIVTSAAQKRKIGRLFDGFRQMTRQDDHGGFTIDYIETDFGTLDVVMDRWCPAGELYIVQKDTCGWITYRDWQVDELAKTGDYIEMQIVGEFGFVVTNEGANAYIHTLATS